MKTEINEIVRLNKPVSQWNPIYHRFECNRCGEQWERGHIQSCQWYKELIEESLKA